MDRVDRDDISDSSSESFEYESSEDSEDYRIKRRKANKLESLIFKQESLRQKELAYIREQEIELKRKRDEQL